MLHIPKCASRDCIHFLGVRQVERAEEGEFLYCTAYPDGIPDDIAYGEDLHLHVRADQTNMIIFTDKNAE